MSDLFDSSFTVLLATIEGHNNSVDLQQITSFLAGAIDDETLSEDVIFRILLSIGSIVFTGTSLPLILHPFGGSFPGYHEFIQVVSLHFPRKF